MRQGRIVPQLVQVHVLHVWLVSPVLLLALLRRVHVLHVLQGRIVPQLVQVHVLHVLQGRIVPQLVHLLVPFVFHVGLLNIARAVALLVQIAEQENILLH